LLIAVPYFLLLAIMLVTGIIQNRQLQARNTSGNVNPQQQAIMKFMPFFLPVFSFGFPAGLALYWCTQNLCRIGTNHYITKSVYAKEHEARAVARPAKGSSKDQASKDGADRDDAKDGGPKSGKPKVGSGRAGSTDKVSSKPAKAEPSGPGKSVKSKKAHEKTTGQRGAGASSASGSRRRSGERRGGPRSGKEV
jgi:YidC/Oxa1 family membrane protein insertase